MKARERKYEKRKRIWKKCNTKGRNEREEEKMEKKKSWKIRNQKWAEKIKRKKTNKEIIWKREWKKGKVLIPREGNEKKKKLMGANYFKKGEKND